MVVEVAATIRPAYSQSFAIPGDVRACPIVACGCHRSITSVSWSAGEKNLDAFKVRGTLDFVVNDACRLQAAVSLVEGHFSLTLVIHGYPSLEDVKHLEIAQVAVESP